MFTIFLLAFITLGYAGYNLAIKFSTQHVPAATTTMVYATLTLQAMTLLVSACFVGFLNLQGGHVFRLNPGAFGWAAFAGLCIGSAEVAYFYLFSGLGHGKAMDANVAIPIIVGGTITITVLVSYFAIKEGFSWAQMGGTTLIVGGIFLMFWGPK